ncbi:cytosolic iron-sulfur protein assembly protein 1 [Paecilomyces variotii No. 5]|uniref:Probable cytosolic iron-sulfur protein assembly protein 1 n=1 Tax=Byssochlamys spectabilis (strain No. 5 / NBRC 109023) TaxID=1356009 RepID=V5G0S5_BYSSN|nr:cytosolic iron-sulfur protein assembly protein 1 [Paecilomyces variotii No. 5]
MAGRPPASISHLADLTPPSAERCWLTSPHPTLPIVATCSSDKTVRVYSLTNFHLLSTISGGHKRSVRSAAWKPLVKGESVLATGSFDATVGIWRRWDSYGRTADGAEEDWGLSAPAPGSSAVANANDSDNEDEDEEWRFAVLLDGHDSEVKSVSWSPSGTLLATCSRDKSIWIWEDLDDGDNNFETVAVMQEHTQDVKCVSWHPVEECLASASYDNTIRMWREDIDDWGQVACLRGHDGTVWYVDWEAVENGPTSSSGEEGEEHASKLRRWKEHHVLSGPRLVSCSDDRTVRIWRRQPKEQRSANSGIPSIIRPMGLDETWYEEAVLPKAHELSIYTVAWSKRSGLVASTGADGRIVVYEERFVPVDSAAAAASEGQQPMEIDGAGQTPQNTTSIDPSLRTEWTVLATMEAAHGIYEVNHVCWAKRPRRRQGEEVLDTSSSSSSLAEEEILITTADDGSVKTWAVKR